MDKMQFIKEIYERYSLIGNEDIFKLQNRDKKTGEIKITPIVTKTGIQKIAAAENFKYSFDVVSFDPEYCAVKCTLANKDGEELASSFGSAEKANVRNPTKYYLEMAEKRAKARAVLIAIGAHGYLYSEDESDDFKQQ